MQVHILPLSDAGAVRNSHGHTDERHFRNYHPESVLRYALVLRRYFSMKILSSPNAFLDSFLASLNSFGRSSVAVYDTHTASAAAVGGFQHDRITDYLLLLLLLSSIIFDRVINTGNNGHHCASMAIFLEEILSPMAFMIWLGRSDKYNAVLAHRHLQNPDSLIRKSIAWMDSIDI